jgi:hypothetical protein
MTASYSIPLPNAESRGLSLQQALAEADAYVRSILAPNETIIGEPTFAEREIPPSWGGREWRWTWVVEINE